jgi:hypothetical protein
VTSTMLTQPKRPPNGNVAVVATMRPSGVCAA